MKTVILIIALVAPMFVFADSIVDRATQIKAAVLSSQEITGIGVLIAKQRNLVCNTPSVSNITVKLGKPSRDKTASSDFVLTYQCNGVNGADVHSLTFSGYAIESGTLISVDLQNLKIQEFE